MIRKKKYLLLSFIFAIFLSFPVPGKELCDSPVASEIYMYLRAEMGLNHSAACGVLGNIRHESNFNPTVYGDGGTSYGICQWHNGRFSSLKSFCGANGLDYTSLRGQLEYLNAELNQSYASVLSYLKSVPDTEEGCRNSARIFCTGFESPANENAQAEVRARTAISNFYDKIFAFGDNGREIVRYLIPFVRGS